MLDFFYLFVQGTLLLYIAAGILGQAVLVFTDTIHGGHLIIVDILVGLTLMFAIKLVQWAWKLREKLGEQEEEPGE